MNIFASIAIITVILNSLLMGVVLASNPRSSVNRMFALYTLCFAFEGLIEFGYSSSKVYCEACFWWRLDFVWPLLWLFSLHYVMAVAERIHSKKGKIFS